MEPTTIKRVELLAPAGDFASLRAAIEAGCDAVYLGGKQFGARAYSNNFTREDLVEAIKLCHLYSVKVYVTCNTIIYENEVPSFLDYVRFLHQNNVDAILIQDLGMLDLVRKKFPNLEIHSSTQMHIHNLDDVKLMEMLGVKRVVLARETSIDTIKDIKAHSNIDLEIFVHGSLCISYSGECLMSSLIGGRSGNRGMCAGTCRLPYNVLSNHKIINKSEPYPLSTKDLNSLENLKELLDTGISSLKIEGRMKSSDYVYCVVKLYRQAIDSYYKYGKVIINESLLHDLKIIFNRGYTNGFLFNTDIHDFINGQRPNHEGIEVGTILACKKKIATIKLSDTIHIGDGLRILGEPDQGLIVNDFYIDNKLRKEAGKGDIITIKVHEAVKPESKVLLTNSQFIHNNIEETLKQNPRKVPISFKLTAKLGQPLTLEVNDTKNKIILEGNIVEPASKLPTSKETLTEKLSKVGNTIYKSETITLECDNNIFIPLKNLNELRRQALEQLNEKRLYQIPFKEEEYSIEVPDFEQTKLKTCLVNSPEQYNQVKNESYDIIYSSLDIPNTIRKYPKVMNSYPDNLTKILAGEVGVFNKYHSNIDTDYSFNVVNSYTVAFLHNLGANKITLSYELNETQITELISNYHQRYHKHPNLEVIVYGYPEIMISKFSLNKYYNNDDLKLEDRYHNLYRIETTNDLMTIYHCKLLDNRNIDYYKLGINSTRINL